MLSKGELANSAFLHNAGKHLESKYHADAVERMKNQRTLFDCGIATTSAVPTAAASLAHVPQKEHPCQGYWMPTVNYGNGDAQLRLFLANAARGNSWYQNPHTRISIEGGEPVARSTLMYKGKRAWTASSPK